MIPITLGINRETGRKFSLKTDTFRTHFHLIGATGTGKTTAIETMIRPILMDTRPKACFFIVDLMGGLAEELLRWIASKRLCPDHVRERLLYIEPAREDRIITINPLLHDSPAHQYYQIARTIEIVLRAWASQDISVMPRLATWTYNSFAAAAEMNYPIAICRYLLQPGTDEHTAILNRLPQNFQADWADIYSPRNRGETARILESTRNRLGPFFRSPILRRMFCSRRNGFDVAQFIRDRRIVILNLASYGRIDTHIGSTIGGVAVNEILNAIITLPRNVVDPTYILLDEFQNFISPDLYYAIPTVRQKGGRFILSHQSFSQLERGDVDLNSIIWQARSRLIFGNDAEDADQMAHELATLTFDPKRIKDIRTTQKQRITGYYKEWLKTKGSSTGLGENWGDVSGSRRSHSSGSVQPPLAVSPTQNRGTAFDESESRSSGGSRTETVSSGEHEVNVPIHEDFEEISNIMYVSFEEWRTLWGKDVRTRHTGEAFGKFVDDPHVYDLLIQRHAMPATAANEAAVKELLQKNFEREPFRSASDIDRELEEMRCELFTEPPLRVHSSESRGQPPPPPSGNGDSPSADPPFPNQ